jgi:23S rRNA (cytidine2498-2'-O)-methyltransferase
MHLLLCAEDSEPELLAELNAAFPDLPARSVGARLWAASFDILPDQMLPPLAFLRQLLPDPRAVRAESIQDWADALAQAVVGVLPEDQPWVLHIEPHYGVRSTHRIGARAWHSATRGRSFAPSFANKTGAATLPARELAESDPERAAPVVSAAAGRNRCRFIGEAASQILNKKRRHLLRQLRPSSGTFTPNISLVQVLLTAPNAGFISVAAAPLPFEQRHWLSRFPKGEVPVASDPAAPSRAFAKLIEAELRLGHAIQCGETCVDLGAAPGSWTYIAAKRGARVLAVDRSPLREDLLRDRRVTFQAGDAFRFHPACPVDWLLCDVLAAPERSAELLVDWLRHRWCRHFIVTLKLKDVPGTLALARLKKELPPLTKGFFLSRLCANKKELCTFGMAG